MKIYTYYQDINFQEQNELINLWKISWSRQGFQPIVLNLADAKKHPYFETLDAEMRRIYKVIVGKDITDYGMSCWFRWLAYATQEEEFFYVSDYDAINVSFSPAELSDKLNLLDGVCPFFASGKPTQFENLCKAFVEVSNERIEILKQQANHYHDQEFVLYNLFVENNPNHQKVKDKYNILITKDRSKFGGKDIRKDLLVYHVSHYMSEISSKLPEYKGFSRVEIVKSLLGLI